MICSAATGPGRLSREIGCFPVPPQSGQGIVLGSSFIDFLCSVVETWADFAASTCREMEQVTRPMIPPDYEKHIRRAFLQVLVLCLCSVVPPLFSLMGIFTPEEEPLGQWFQRSGAVMTTFAAFAQFKSGGIATMIAGGAFAETWEAYHKYNRFQALASWLSLVLVVIGTLIWAYGDLLFPEPPKNRQRSSGVDLS
jgi:hypothetical protein